MTDLERRRHQALVATTVAIADIRDERRRQVDGEGFDAAHDEGYGGFELERAAAAYALASRHPEAQLWPWGPGFWKPTSHRRNLIKAGALIVAAIERLDRLEAEAAKAVKS